MIRSEGFGRLGADGYGFESEEDDSGSKGENSSLSKIRLPERTLRLQDIDYKMNFVYAKEYEYESLQVFHGEVRTVETNEVVANLGGIVIYLGHSDMRDQDFILGQGLHCVADAVTQEVYDMSVSLFTPLGEAKGDLKMQLGGLDRRLTSLLYINGVFVTKAHMGRGLGLEMTRHMLTSLQQAGLWARGPDSIAVLCPAGDPPKEGKTWSDAFKKLSRHFGKLGFRQCGTSSTVPVIPQGPLDQNMYMFLESKGFLREDGSAPLVVSEQPNAPKKRKVEEAMPSRQGTETTKKERCSFSEECHVKLVRVKNHAFSEDDESVGYECSVCGSGPYCNNCWADTGSMFCAGECRRMYCEGCNPGFKFSDTCEMYCRKECAPPGTKFQSFGSSDSDDGDN